jgi:B-cell receptor-associated protein 31
MRRAVFRFFGTNPIVGQVLYCIKISIIFVSIFFVDAVRQLLRVMEDRRDAKQALGVRDSAHHDLLVKLAFAQRNCYLCGFTLFCSLILSRTYMLVNELIDTQTQLEQVRKNSGSSTTGSADAATLKKQVGQQQEEYNRLSDELNKSKGQPVRGKAD